MYNRLGEVIKEDIYNVKNLSRSDFVISDEIKDEFLKIRIKKSIPSISDKTGTIVIGGVRVKDDPSRTPHIANEDKKPEENELSSIGEIRVLFTSDRRLLSEYYELREESFRNVDVVYKEKTFEEIHEFEACDGSENVDDMSGKILVAIDKNKKVIAGMRFLISDWTKNSLNEEPDISVTIRGVLKEIGLNYKAKYVEVEDVVIKKPYGNGQLIRKMFGTLVKQSEALKCEYGIGVAVLSAARTHKIALAGLKYKSDIILGHPWASQNNHGYELRYPLIIHLKKFRSLTLS